MPFDEAMMARQQHQQQLHPYMKAKFQIGSAQGRQNYEQGEHVFHVDDVPAKAKSARREVAAMVKSHTLAHTPPFTQSTYTGETYSGTKRTVWDGNRYADRVFRRRDAEGRAADVAAARKELMERGPDPWNSSTFTVHGKSKTHIPGWVAPHEAKKVAPPPFMSTHTGETELGMAPSTRALVGRDEEAAAARPMFTTRLPSGYKSLYQQELDHEEAIRRRKADERRVADLRRRDDLMLRTMHGSDQTFPGLPAVGGGRDVPSKEEREALAETLSRTYNMAALEEYNRTIDARAVREAAVTSPRRTAKNFEKVRKQGVGRRPGPQVVRGYEHRGCWAHSEVEGCEVWSCCMNSRRDSQGCTSSVIVDQRRWNTASS